ncbi:alpha/beta hydrolase [Salsipaludibacter albus]|uniref:alpha/beta hydrolase n=1 Tax=Salsipaludibacter albus TaxID=2849650 RepID=UPI0030840BAB
MQRQVVALAVLSGLVALLVIGAWLGQRRLVYFPSQVVPAEAPAGVTPVVLATSDDLRLAAWHLEGRPGVADRPATVVVFHGNGGNRTGRLPLARALARRGHDVLLVDYRGYGGNPGSPSSTGLARDADAARDWVDRHAASTTVAYLGESLGAGVAVELATRRPPDVLVLRSPFTSLADVARVHYPIVPAAFLRDRWPNLERVADLDVPTLVVAGEADTIVPVEQSRRVERAAAGPSDLVVVPGADHNDRALLDGGDLVTAIDDLLHRHPTTGDEHAEE